jgi:hypothetical protein
MEKRILEEELEDLQSDVLHMGALVEKAPVRFHQGIT